VFTLKECEIMEEEAESVIKDAEKFLERIKEAIREVDTETWKSVTSPQKASIQEDGSNTSRRRGMKII